MNLGTPWLLMLLSLVVLAGWLMRRARRLQYEAACRLKGVTPEDKSAGLRRRDWLALAALACVVLALARPRWNPRPYDVERRGRDLVIALDISRSMLAADVFPSRLEVARIAIHEAFPALTGQRIALITFAGSASVRVPLTLDHEFVRYMLERADPSDMDIGSTSLQAAVEKAVGTVLTDATSGGRDLVVFTDGEDHLSDIAKTAGLLAECGARVLIIGLGDPVRGARVPDTSETNQWMRYKDADVVSRLEERTLEKLSAKSPNVTYFPARTRPFDLMTLYEHMISGAGDDVVVGELRQVRYTEGYPYLLGLSVVLWLTSSPWGRPAVQALILIAILLPGCARRVDDNGDAAFRAKVTRGDELLEYAQEQAVADSAAQRSLLLDAREQFLRAALLRPGDIETARRITAMTRRLRKLEAAIEKQLAEEEKRHEGLTEIIGKLEKLTQRQTRLSQQSTRLLARRQASPTLTLNAEDNNMIEEDTTANSRNDSRAASQSVKEQQVVHERTTKVSDSLKSQQNTLRQLLKQAYGDIGRLPATELDPITVLLTEALAAQEQAMTDLAPGAIRWPRANTAFHTAAGRMQQALESLRSLQPPAKDQDDTTMASNNDGDYDEDIEGPDSDTQDKKSQAVTAGDYEASLSLRSLPVPNYTSAEILEEESANQERRTKQRAARAGAKVEKNW